MGQDKRCRERSSLGMKWLALMLLLGRASALDPWTWGDTAAEAAYLTLHALDWGQTNDIVSPIAWHKLPGGGAWREQKTYHETNPFLGHNPSRGRVATYFLSTAGLHVGLARVLPAPWRRAFQVGTIGLEGWVVGRNAQMGFSVRF